MRQPRKLVVKNKDYNYQLNPTTKTASRPTATQLLNQAFGDSWQQFYSIEKLSTMLSKLFQSRGWSVASIQNIQRSYWIAGNHYIKNGDKPKSPVSYNIVNIVQWHLDRQ